MIIKECKDAAEVATASVDYILGMAREAITTNGVFHIALSGGSTPKAVFDVLARHPGLTREIVEKTHLWWGDERSVPHDHPESNVGMARRHFINPVGFPEKNIHAPNGGAEDLEVEALRYEEEIRRMLSDDPLNIVPFHLVWLGMGTDGHTASLFPGTKGLDAKDRYFIVNEVPQLKTTRLTLSFEGIELAGNIMLTITGNNKADILAHVLTDGADYPINRVLKTPTGIVIADSSALSALSDNQRTTYIATN